MPPKLSILIAACDAVLSQVYAHAFEREGWEVQVCDNLPDAERHAVQMRPVVFLFETACVVDVPREIRRLKALPTLQKTRIVVLDDKAHRLGIHAAQQAGASEYLVLGHFSPLDVVAKMKRLVGV